MPAPNRRISGMLRRYTFVTRLPPLFSLTTPSTNFREDAATAEVSRSQLWQWVRHGVTTAEGHRVDKAYALRLLRESADQLAAKAPKGNKYKLAAQYFAGQVTGEDYAEFLTT